MEIKYKKLNELAIAPTVADIGSAGNDLYAAIPEPVTIPVGETSLIPTGISCAIPYGYFGAIYARSGLAIKKGLAPANCVGVIDSSYRGEIMVCLRNSSQNQQTIIPGDRIAQMVIQKFTPIRFVEVNELDNTDRGDGGFGSSGR